jgi:hypothetical protein
VVAIVITDATNTAATIETALINKQSFSIVRFFRVPLLCLLYYDLVDSQQYDIASVEVLPTPLWKSPVL